MYALVPLDRTNALDFEPLAPFEVRHVLYDLAALDRVHAIGATLMGRPVGLGLAVRGWGAVRADGKHGKHEERVAGGGAGAGGASGAEGVSAIPPPADSARLLTLTVARSYRRLGIGRAMLARLERELAEQGVRTLACNYALPSAETREALEAMFAATGWEAPTTTMLQCRAAHSLLDAPLMREQIVLPPEYEIVDWVDLDATERAHIRARQREAAWYPETLDPFHFEPELEPLNSLALRYHGEVVGWLITRRTSPLTMYYRCLFVRTDLARLGRGLALICEAIGRHHALVGARPGYGEWSTPMSLPAMVRFIRRHLEPYGTQVVEQRAARKVLAPVVVAGAGGAGESGAARGSDSAPRTARAPSRAPITVPLFSRDECARIVADVLAARAEWTARFDTIPFATLGAVAQLDAFDSAEDYERVAAQKNTMLAGRFGWMYERLFAALGSALSRGVRSAPGWGLPAVHIVSGCPGANLPIRAVHADVQHQYVAPGEGFAERPVSFCVLLTPEEGSAAVTFWGAEYPDSIGLDTEETARLLDQAPRTEVGMRVGELLVHPSDRFHQVSPLPSRAPDFVRITLEGNALRDGDGWLAYG